MIKLSKLIIDAGHAHQLTGILSHMWSIFISIGYNSIATVVALMVKNLFKIFEMCVCNFV